MALEVRSSRDVVVEALRDLNIIPGDAEPEGFELDNGLARWEELHADLADDELIEFPADEIPIEAFRACWGILRDVVGRTYGRTDLRDPDDPQHPSRIRFMRRLANRDAGEVLPIQEF